MGKKRVAKKAGEETSKEPQTAQGAVKTEQVPSEVVAAPQPLAKTGRVYIFSSYNNTIMSLADTRGNVLATTSAGAIGFKGTKKSTPFAASKVADTILQNAKNKGIGKIEVFVRGIGTGRDAALRAIGGKDIEVLAIRDITPVAHNGPKAPKVRRV